jgi:hypothetical protein
MPSHFANYIIDKASSGVILVSKKMSIAEAVEEIILIWELSEAHEWINRIAKLPL